MGDRRDNVEENPEIYEGLDKYIGIRCFEKKEWGRLNFAIDSDTNKKVAIKSYKSPLRADSEYFSEKRILRKIKQYPHRYVMKLLEIIEHDKWSHIIIEDCGSCLSEHMKYIHTYLRYSLDDAGETGRASAPIMHIHHQIVSRILREIIHGVDHLHRNNISHCDLTLDNIMIHYDTHIRIIDFGLSNMHVGKSWPKDGRRVGTNNYISHEAYVGREVDPRDNDIWSIGVILWVMLLWRWPWEHPHRSDIRFDIIFGEGKKGIKKVMKMYKKEYGESQRPRFCLKREQVDFLARIFCHEKHRLTLRRAKRHPIFDESIPLGPIISPKIKSEIPCQDIEERIHSSRYDTRPWQVDRIWESFDPRVKKEIIAWLLERDKRYEEEGTVTVLDERIVGKMKRRFKLNKDQAISIILHFWFFSDPAHHEYFHDQPFFRPTVRCPSPRSPPGEDEWTPSPSLLTVRSKSLIWNSKRRQNSERSYSEEKSEILNRTGRRTSEPTNLTTAGWLRSSSNALRPNISDLSGMPDESTSSLWLLPGAGLPVSPSITPPSSISDRKESPRE